MDDSKFNSGISNAQSGFSKFGSVVGGIATAAVASVAAIGTALVGLGTAATKIGIDYEAAMSQVAATMGISADKGDAAFARLSEAAKEAGQTTQFSATEAAEALNYLALAGYNAGDAADALPIVLNLAAAGGLDLAYASDLATDSMASLGLETSQLTGFTDELARTSQKSNTSVAQLGEAILNVGGTARDLAGGTVELNTVLGLFADQGLKGSEAGTKLRNVILKVGGAYDVLGVSAYDANGDMRPLEDTFAELNEVMADFTTEERQNALTDIFGLPNVAAANTLLNTNSERWAELAAEIESADGAAKQMANTMIDNLKGDITILGSALQGLGIEFYESINSPLRDIAQSATTMVGDLTDAFQQGGLEGLVGELGNAFATVVTQIAQYAPRIIDMATNLIGSFVGGIRDNLPEIVNGGVQIVESLLAGIFELLPEIAVAAVEIIAGLATGIGQALPELIPAAVEAITTIVTGLLENLPLLLDAALQLIVGLAEGLINAIPILIDSLPTIITAIVDFLIGAIPQIIQAGIELLTALVGALPDIISAIVDAIPQIIDGIVTAVLEGLPLIIQAGVDLLVALIQNLPEIIVTIVTALPEIVLAIANALIDNIDVIIQAGFDLFVALIGALPDIIVAIVSAVPEIVSGIVSGFTELIPNLVEVGANLMNGIKEGIGNLAGSVVEKVKDVGGSIVGGFKSFFGIASPSKLMAEMGGYLMDGLSGGIEDGEKEVQKSTEKVSKSIKGDLSDVDPKENNLGDWISDLSSTANAGVPSVIEGIVSMFAELPGKIYESISSTQDILAQWANSLTEIGTSKFNEFVSAAQNIMATAPSKIGAALEPAKNVVEAWGNAIIQIGRSRIEEFITVIINIAQTIPQKLSDAIKPAVEEVQKWADQLIAKAQSELPKFVKAAVDAVSPIVSEFKTIGSNMVEGLWAGVDSKSGWFYANLSSFTSKIVKQVKTELDIRSPSRVFQEMGELTAEGFIVGLEKMATAVDNTIADIFNPDLSFGADFTGVNGFGGSQVAMPTGSSGGAGNTYNTTVYPSNAYSERQLANQIEAKLTSASWGWR